MGVKYKVIGDIAVIKVKGNLIGDDESRDVRERVQEVTSAGIRKVIIDLHGVKWMNSHGVGIIMACYSTIYGAEGKLHVSRISDKVRLILDLTKVITLFDTFDSIHEAVKAFK